MAQTKKLRAAIIGAGGRARSSHYVCVSRLSDAVELGAMAELDPVLMQVQYSTELRFTFQYSTIHYS